MLYLEKQKILLIEASKRENSLTHELALFAVSLFSGGELTEYNAFSSLALPCDGCNYCETAKKCRHRDLDGFFYEYENADVIIIATPVYNDSVPAPLKAVIDRFQVYYTRFYSSGRVQPVKKRRKAFFISSAGRDGEFPYTVIYRQLKNIFSITNVEFFGGVMCPFTDTAPNKEAARSDIKKLITERM